MGNRSMSRRRFIRLAAGAGAVSALSALAGCAPKTIDAMEANQKAGKTIDCDVLVIGAGAAGITAAEQAAEAGAKVILIEKMGWIAGSSSLAIGTLYGAGTQLQKAQGIQDTPEALLQYFLSRGGDKLDYDMQKFCADHFGETIDWLNVDLGVPFKKTVSKKSVDTIPRGHNIDANANVAVTAMAKKANEVGVEFQYQTAAESFIVENGAVVGVLARRSPEKLYQYRAKKTIVAAGGFARNDDMIAEYMPDYEGVYTEVGVGCTGETIQMGFDIGAGYIGHGGTNGILNCPVAAGQSKLISANAMWINTQGERFTNEGGQTHDIYYQVAHFDDRKFYAVYDQKMVDALNATLKEQYEAGLEKGLFAKADTVQEAAEKLGIDGAKAAESLDAYNQMAAAGADTQFNKKAEQLKPLATPPYSVLTMTVATHGTFGGYNVDTQFRVLDEAGHPIENLYAAGENCSGTFIYDDYPGGGCGLCFAFTSGRWAGKNAAEAARA